MSGYKEQYPYKLLVEGNEDKWTVIALRETQHLPENFDVIDCHCVEEAKKALQLRLKSTNDTKKIGIIIDADTNPQDRWNSLRNILIRSGKYNANDIPPTAPENGFILEPQIKEDITIGVWIMPNNTAQGMLEDFVYAMAPFDDPLLTKVDETLTEIETEKIAKYKEVHKAKARLRTWLAWQEEPGVAINIAIKKNLLSADVPNCRNFITWLKDLFQ